MSVVMLVMVVTVRAVSRKSLDSHCCMLYLSPSGDLEQISAHFRKQNEHNIYLTMTRQIYWPWQLLMTSLSGDKWVPLVWEKEINETETGGQAETDGFLGVTTSPFRPLDLRLPPPLRKLSVWSGLPVMTLYSPIFAEGYSDDNAMQGFHCQSNICNCSSHSVTCMYVETINHIKYGYIKRRNVGMLYILYIMMI